MLNSQGTMQISKMKILVSLNSFQGLKILRKQKIQNFSTKKLCTYLLEPVFFCFSGISVKKNY